MRHLGLLLSVALLSSCGGGGGNPGTCTGSPSVCGISTGPSGGTSGGSSGGSTGGGTTTPDPVPSENPNGIYTGTTSNGRTGTFIVLDENTLWGFYSAVGQPNVIAGMFHGLVRKDSSGKFTVPALRDFNLEGLGINDAMATSTYVTGSSVSGQVAYRNSTVTFTAAYDPTYAVPTNQNLVAGTYRGQSASSLGLNEVSFTVSQDGAISGTGYGCSYSGKMTPRATGYVYDTSISFRGSCAAAGYTVEGISYYDPATSTLLSGGLAGGRSVAGIFLGRKV